MWGRGSILAVVLAAVVVLTSAAVPAGASADSPTSGDRLPASAAPPDPPTDRLGWEGGYWYNESLSLTPDDGFNVSEVEQLTLRSMARVERIRGLEYNRTPDVTFVSRDAWEEYTSTQLSASNITTADRLHQNTKYEALFLVGETSDYFDVREGNRGSFAAALYFYGEPPGDRYDAGDILIITSGEGVARLNEPTLAHELLHALQDQTFDLSAATDAYGAQTVEGVRAQNSVIEGEARLVQRMYEARCGGAWNCADNTETGGGSQSFADLGLVVYQLMVYREGVSFVEAIQSRGGWAAVNDLYSDPASTFPASTEQVIHPEAYGNDSPTTVTVADRSNEAWTIPQTSGPINYATVGEAGIFMMFWAPGSLRDVPYSYQNPASEGWDGDRLVPYARANASASGETGYVWKIVWDTPADAREFASAYRAKLQDLGAVNVSGAEDVYVIPERENEAFGDAFALAVNGTATVIVNAPSVAALNGVRAGTVPEGLQWDGPTTTTTVSTTRSTTTTEATTQAGTTTNAPTTSGDGGPGFGPVVTLLVVLGVTWLLGRDRRSS
ncbi:MAG: Hvo_1808 family surface protein [Halobacteriaceae archaeon]